MQVSMSLLLGSSWNHGILQSILTYGIYRVNLNPNSILKLNSTQLTWQNLVVRAAGNG